MSILLHAYIRDSCDTYVTCNNKANVNSTIRRFLLFFNIFLFGGELDILRLLYYYFSPAINVSKQNKNHTSTEKPQL